MIISGLINQLEEVKSHYGDLVVYLGNGWEVSVTGLTSKNDPNKIDGVVIYAIEPIKTGLENAIPA